MSLDVKILGFAHILEYHVRHSLALSQELYSRQQLYCLLSQHQPWLEETLDSVTQAGRFEREQKINICIRSKDKKTNLFPKPHSLTKSPVRVEKCTEPARPTEKERHPWVHEGWAIFKILPYSDIFWKMDFKDLR